MKSISRVISGMAVTFVLTMSAVAQDEGKTPSQTASNHVAVKEADLQWGAAPPALPAGAQMAVLQGDPTAAGPFTIRLKAAAGYKIPLHTHPTDEVVTVLSGNVDFTLGSATSAAESYGAGSFLLMPAGMQHAASMTGETVVQVSSQGPFEINYVDPKDDPRRK